MEPAAWMRGLLELEDADRGGAGNSTQTLRGEDLMLPSIRLLLRLR